MTAAASTPELPVDDSGKDEPDQPRPEGEASKETKEPKPKTSGKSIPVVDASEVSEQPEVTESLEEVNESIKAMAPNLGDTSIEAVEDEDADELALDDEAVNPEKPISDELTDELEAEDAAVSTADPDNATVQAVTPGEQSEQDEETDEEKPDDSTAEAAESPPAETEAEADSNAREESGEAGESEDGLPDDEETREAVDEIIAEESDAVMAAEDLARDLENEAAEPVKKKEAWFKKLVSTPRRRWILGGGVLALLLITAIVPQSRYFMLNNLGVRSSLSVRVIDSGTLQPLRNVSVQAGGSSAMTGSDGLVRLENVRHGRTNLQIEKRAFATISKPITVGWGSNPLGDIEAKAVGSRYSFVVKDFISGNPIVGAEANSGEGDAVSDEEGLIVLTLDTAELADDIVLTVSIDAASYRQEVVELPVNNREAQNVEMVPAHKHVFVSKRSGNYDVYKIDADGKNEERIVEGTGIERDDITLVPHQSLDVAALVSTRERVLNASGYLLSTLHLLNTEDGDLVKIDQSEQVQIVGWSDSGRLVYVKIAAGKSTADPKRHRLMSINSNDYSDVKELASSNSFNDVMIADGVVYYAPSNIFQEDPNPGMFAVQPDGSGKKTILNREVYNIFRSSYEKLDISIGATWYSYTLGSEEMATPSQPPASQYSRVYADNPELATSLWVDTRDGKGVLISYDKTKQEETVLYSRGGLKLPLYWLNQKYIIFRLNDGKETADYVMNTEGGEPRKIVDVTDTNGVDRWYYY